ncbi:MAG: hypothetical protein U9Q80_06920 [Bacillota bacterium]|nr:hypothetical protein [Bacillota bacterium]
MRNNKAIQLFIGLLLYAIGIVLTINANLGVAPWDTFHQGISNIIGITFGQASIIVGLLIVFINYFLSEKIGYATIANMIVIGLFIDVIFAYDLLPVSTSFLSGLFMIFIGMVVIAFATYFYIKAGLGIGPRDGLMVGLKRKTNLPIGVIRGGIEITVLFIGVSLGGQIGIGTLIIALSIGPIVEITFKMLDFKVSEVKHDYIAYKKSV